MKRFFGMSKIKRVTRIEKEEEPKIHGMRNLYANHKPLKDKYKQKGGVVTHPARLLVIGPPGSGKTLAGNNIALDHLDWDTLDIYARNPDQPLFHDLINYVTEKVEDIGGNLDDYLHVSTEIDREPKDYDQNQQHLIIIDDLTGKNDKSNVGIVEKFLKYGRPNNISLIILTQTFFDTAPQVRENVSHFLCFKGKSPRDKAEMHKFYASDLEKDEFEKLYKMATTKEHDDDQDAFLFIDTRELVPGKKFRRSVIPYSLFDNEGNMIVKSQKRKLEPLKHQPWKEDEEGNLVKPYGSLSKYDRTKSVPNEATYSPPKPPSSFSKLQKAMESIKEEDDDEGGRAQPRTLVLPPARKLVVRKKN